MCIRDSNDAANAASAAVLADSSDATLVYEGSGVFTFNVSNAADVTFTTTVDDGSVYIVSSQGSANALYGKGKIDGIAQAEAAANFDEIVSVEYSSKQSFIDLMINDGEVQIDGEYITLEDNTAYAIDGSLLVFTQGGSQVIELSLPESSAELSYAVEGANQALTADILNYAETVNGAEHYKDCLLYTSPSPRDRTRSRMPSSA